MNIINNQDVESISRILGDNYLTGSKIGRMLYFLKLPDPFPKNTKWKRIEYAILEVSSRTQTTKVLFDVIEYVANPSNFINDSNAWDTFLLRINSVLIAKGYQLEDDSKIHRTEATSSYSDLQKRLETLESRIKALELHSEVTKYCTKELIQKDYFHAVFESCKGLFDRIRLISDLTTDGGTLINQAFNINKQPLIMIQGNPLRTIDEKNQYYGLVNSIKTCLYLYRNHQAHVPRIFDDLSLNDAIRGLMSISLAHELLDHCVFLVDFHE
ncbi:TIGR02391 family protein [Lactococcus lactis]|uniref:TIGR02391 family protein n=1 Tax=Lactococcus lactis TaxID=1358 RepID=UPI003D150477